MITNNDKRFINLSLKVARQSQCKFKLGATIVRQGIVIATAPNIERVRSISRFNEGIRNNPNHAAKVRRERSTSTHAEVHCILSAREDLRGCSLYVARITRHDECVVSRPCESCQQIIELSGIKTVIYINEQGEICKVKL